MINLFFITDSYPEIDRYCKELISYLAVYKTIKLHVVYVHSDKKEFLVTKQNSITEIYIPEPLIENFNTEKYYSLCATLIYSQFSHLKNVIFHFNIQTMVSMALILQNRFDCKIVYTLHSLPNNYLNYKYSELIVNPTENIEEMQYGQMLEVADQVICVNQFLEGIVGELFDVLQTKTNTIYYGMDYIHPDINTNKMIIKEQFGFNLDEKIVLYLEKPDFPKGLDSLLKAFKEVLVKFPKTRLMISGKGVFNDDLKNEILGKVHFIGNAGWEDFHKFYYLADIGIIPSSLEQCSYTAIEMMYCGIPVIISDRIIGLFTHEYDALKFKHQVNADEKTLTLVPDETDLATQIERLISEPDLANKLSRNAKKKARREFTRKLMGAKTLEIYKKLIMSSTESNRN